MSTKKQSKLLEKISKSTTNKYSSILSESEFFGQKEHTPTNLPILNLAFSGDIQGGFYSGLTTIAGPSKHFKSMLGLYAVAAYLDKHKDAICIYYDSEFGAPPSYLKTHGIDLDRVFHVPIEHIEQLKFDLVKMLDTIDRGDKVIIFIDSVGNLASKKEVEDAHDQKSVADMTRAKALKSLFRITTPQFTIKDIPCVVVNHTYKSMGLFPTDVVSGGTGSIYSSDTIFIIGRSKEKDGSDLSGYKFTIKIEKSRFVFEGSKFPFIVTFKGGIKKYSGLFGFALEEGYIESPSKGWYTRVLCDENGEVIEDKKWRKADTECNEFWDPILNETDFPECLRKRFAQGTQLIQQKDEKQ